jgi:flavin reductase (DIM6/NTAB) family NADH-FMN oxidoreductase RutF
MDKLSKEPGTLLSPVPVVMVSCARPGEKPNIITLAWVGTVCSEPPMVSISIRPSRFSHEIIRETGEFVINVPSRELLEATDVCGIVSGRNVDKFAACRLTAEPAERVAAPLIKECPINLECRVRQTYGLGSHDLFIAEILKVHAPAEQNAYLTQTIAYGEGRYISLGEVIGTYGFTKGQMPGGTK